MSNFTFKFLPCITFLLLLILQIRTATAYPIFADDVQSYAYDDCLESISKCSFTCTTTLTTCQKDCDASTLPAIPGYAVLAPPCVSDGVCEAAYLDCVNVCQSGPSCYAQHLL